MDVLATGINAAVVSAVGALLTWQMSVRFKQIERRLDRIEDRFDRGMEAIRSDLTRVALGVGVKPEAETGG